jgi:hypothetical protein
MSARQCPSLWLRNSSAVPSMASAVRPVTVPLVLLSSDPADAAPGGDRHSLAICPSLPARTCDDREKLYAGTLGACR